MIKYTVCKEDNYVLASYGDTYYDVYLPLMRMINNINRSVYNIFGRTQIKFNPQAILDKYIDSEMMFLNGWAKCHPDDEWNEQIGKKVAKDRLNKQYQGLKKQILREMENSLFYTQYGAMKIITTKY